MSEARKCAFCGETPVPEFDLIKHTTGEPICPLAFLCLTWTVEGWNVFQERLIAQRRKDFFAGLGRGVDHGEIGRLFEEEEEWERYVSLENKSR